MNPVSLEKLIKLDLDLDIDQVEKGSAAAGRSLTEAD